MRRIEGGGGLSRSVCAGRGEPPTGSVRGAKQSFAGRIHKQSLGTTKCPRGYYLISPTYGGSWGRIGSSCPLQYTKTGEMVFGNEELVRASAAVKFRNHNGKHAFKKAGVQHEGCLFTCV